MDKYSFEFCPSFRVSASSQFSLKLPVYPFFLFSYMGLMSVLDPHGGG